MHKHTEMIILHLRESLWSSTSNHLPLNNVDSNPSLDSNSLPNVDGSTQVKIIISGISLTDIFL